jgi:hypothetical protein
MIICSSPLNWLKISEKLDDKNNLLKPEERILDFIEVHCEELLYAVQIPKDKAEI